MFYKQFIELCQRNNEKPTPLIKSLGLSAGNIKRWENGATINSDILLKIAEHFKVSIDYLLIGEDKNLSTNLTEEEQDLLKVYRKLPEPGKQKLIVYADVLMDLSAKVSSEPHIIPAPTTRKIRLAGYESGISEIEIPIDFPDPDELLD